MDALLVLNTMLQLTIAERILIVAKYFETKSVQEVLRLFDIISTSKRSMLSQKYCNNELSLIFDLTTAHTRNKNSHYFISTYYALFES